MQTERHIDLPLHDPDGYWKISDSERATLVRAKLEPQLREQYKLVNKIEHPETKRVCLSLLRLVTPLTEIFISMHESSHWKKSWREINPHACERLEKRLIGVKNDLQDNALYTDALNLLTRAIDAHDVETNTEISYALRELAILMTKQDIHLPVLVFSLDNYMTGSDDMEHLEPDLKVILRNNTHTELAELVHKTYGEVGGKSLEGEITPIIGDLVVWGGWMIGSLSCGDNLLDNLYLLLPKQYKYYDKVFRAAQAFSLSMSREDAERCMVRLFTAHEYGHGVYTSEEFSTDRVAIPTALHLAAEISPDELRRQALFILVESSTALGVNAQRAYEKGYEVSAIATLNTLTACGLFAKGPHGWDIDPARYEQTKASMLSLPENPEPIHPHITSSVEELLKEKVS